jgi:GntR family transcriptional regulator, transcriptional repressor for pyruvate dehydrogenase complex
MQMEPQTERRAAPNAEQEDPGTAHTRSAIGPMSTSSIGNRPRASLTAQVLQALSSSIESGSLKPGDRLPSERELMATYRVSRTVVRGAIASLRSSGRIDTQQGRGAFVQAPPPACSYVVDASDLAKIGDVLQILDLRIGLESEAASLAAQRHTPVQLRRIRAALDTLEAGIRAAQTAVNPDVEFHLEIIRATGNAYFIDLFTQLGPLMIPRARLDLFRNDRRAKVRYLALIQQEHAQIYQAIARRDAEAARAAARLHLTNSRERLRATLERTPRAVPRRGSRPAAAGSRR